MQGYFVIFALALIILFVLLRSRQMKKLGIKAFHFGKMDKKDFLIPPFVFLYFYLIIANAFSIPKIGKVLANDPVAAWIGVLLCILAPALFFWGMVSLAHMYEHLWSLFFGDSGWGIANITI